MKILDPDVRVPVQVSSGVHLAGVALPHNDTRCALSLAAGGLNRVCSLLPRPNPTVHAEYKLFAARFFRKHFRPLPSDTVLDHKEWLFSRPYSLKKKMNMWRQWEECFGQLVPDDLKFGVFSKDEDYTKWAMNRLINAPSDVAKIYFGPIIAEIEKQLYKTKWFIKKVPVHMRPQFLRDMEAKMAALCQKSASDYASYECSFTREQKEAVELPFTEYMVQNIPGNEKWMTEFRSWIASSLTEMVNKYFTIYMEETSRYSGEITTSAFNGLTNVIIHEFIAQRTGQHVEFIVEGDDCLAIWEKSAPTEADYEELGFKVALELHSELETTSFCGQVFAPEDMTVMTDPRYVLAGIGWLPQRYLHSKESVKLCLLRAKAWSCGYQYQGTPILASLARYLLRITASYDARKAFEHLDLYKAELLEQAMEHFDPSIPDELQKQVGMASRQLVEKLYGIPIAVQLRYESYFDSQTELGEIPDWICDFPAAWTDCWDTYVRETANDPFLASHPPEVWRPLYPTEVAIPIKPRNRRWKAYVSTRIKVVSFPVNGEE